MGILRLMAILGALCAVFPGNTAALAGSGTIDAVLAIDTSGSMKKTDPSGLRVEAAKLFLSLLEDGNRVGVLAFDTASRDLHPLQVLGQDRSAPLERLNHITSDGQFTNLEKALRRAYDMLPRADGRERCIILMTDGKMDIGDPEEDRLATERLLGTFTPFLRKEGVRVYTIAFTSFSDLDFLKQLALNTRGFFYLARRDTDLHVTFTNIYDNLAGPETLPIQGNEFYVDRSVMEMNIVVTKASQDTNVELIHPDRVRLTHERHPPEVRWFRSSSFVMINVPEPMVGTWRVRYGAEKGNRVFILTDLRLMTSVKSHVVPRDELLPVEVWLQEGEGEGKVLSLQEVSVTCEVETAEGGLVSLPLLDDGRPPDREPGDGVFTGVFQPSTTGEHLLRIHAKTMTFERQKEHPFYVPEEEMAILKDPQERNEVAAPGPAHPPAPPAEAPSEGVDWGWVLVRLLLINGAVALIVAGVFGYRRVRGRKAVVGED